MDSALRPREIQSRIRAGQSLEEVARIAGVPAERIEAYATPVLAEREHVAGLALAATVRRRGESGAHRTLRPVVRQRLTSQRVDPDTVHWDAWRNEDRRWSVQATWVDDEDQPHAATFYFDLRSRFSIAADDEARWLLAEGGATEPADDELSDELALVRVVSPAVPPAADNEPTIALTNTDSAPAEPIEQSPDPAPETHAGHIPAPVGTATPAADDAHDFLPRSAATPLEIGEAVEAEIDSYGLIPDGRSELDVLYDMLGGIAEDSINIYAGLADPVVQEATGDSQWDSQPQSTSETEAPATPATAQPPKPQPAGPPAASSARPSAPTESGPPSSAAAPPKPAESAAGRDPATAANESDLVCDQPALTEEAEATVPLKPGAAKRRRKGRAQVPSWEEIMFGSPKTD